MITDIGIPFVMTDFLEALSAIGKRLDPPDFKGSNSMPLKKGMANYDRVTYIC